MGSRRIITTWITVTVAVMFALPFCVARFAPADAGMALCMIIFLIVNPVHSAILGFCCGKNIRQMWNLPLVSSVAFLAGAWLFFDIKEAWFIIYASVYLIIGWAAMGAHKYLISQNSSNIQESIMNKYNFMCKAFIALGRGIGQIMFQKNAASGYLMLIGILCNSWTLVILAIIGCAVGTSTAYIAGYNRKEIKDGLYGFNGALSGIAAGIFLSGSIPAFIAAMLTSVLSTFITKLINRQKIMPGLTAPFIFAVWIMLAICTWCFPKMLSMSNNNIDTTECISWLKALSLGIGQVMFQGSSLVTGLIFLGAIAINSRTNALYTIIGALLPIPLTLILGAENVSINEGLFGYNGVLCAIAIGTKSLKNFGWSVFAIFLSTLLQLWGIHKGITTLTAPFVISVWATIFLRKLLDKVCSKSSRKQ